MYFIFFCFQFCEISINGNTSDESYINKKKKTETKEGLTSSLPSRTMEKGEGREGYACTSHEVQVCSTSSDINKWQSLVRSLLDKK